jgi:hypothetical protein
MSTDVKPIPLAFIVNACLGIGFEVIEEKEHPEMIVLQRGDSILFLNSLDGLLDFTFVLEDADSCGGNTKDKLLEYMISHIRAGGIASDVGRTGHTPPSPPN